MTPEDLTGTDILDLSTYRREDLSFKRGDENDLIITAPSGSSITVKEQFSLPAGGEGTNIEVFRLRGETMSDKIMRQLFFPAEPEK